MNTRLKILSTSMLFLLLLIAGSLALVLIQRRATELLLVWGTQDAQCILQVINPSTRRVMTSYTSSTEECRHQVLQIGDRAALVHLEPKAGRLTVYQFDLLGNLVPREEFANSAVEFTSWLASDWQGDLYVSGIVNEIEQIYRLDIDADSMVPVTNTAGMASEPAISPDGTRLSYLADPRATNRHQLAGGGPSNTQRYVVSELGTTQEMELSPYPDEPDFPHCNLRWSPTGRYVAFDSGCANAFEPFQTIIVDISNREPEAILEASSELFPHVYVITWLSENEFIYAAKRDFPPDNPVRSHQQYFLYDLEANTSTEVRLFSLLEMPFASYGMLPLGWGPERRFAALLDEAGSNGTRQTLLFGRIDENGDVLDANFVALNTLADRSTMPPQWSSSGNWIAVGEGSSLSIVNTEQAEHYPIDVSDLEIVGYAWISNGTH